MRHSPFSSPSKALTFVVLVVMGGLFLADTVDDVSVEPAANDQPDSAPEPSPMATVASLNTPEEPATWDDEGAEDNTPDIVIADYQPNQRVGTAPRGDGEIQFSGRRRIPETDTRIVK
ncbi:hypothetical protein [Aurantiacibacter sp. D1-12]|uniref:hypothetical protein n=1 Tax=Aurantiacibacter sp. D1-12 TaxID=2993658 RepID=UPI00237C611F|nr:hypothetical protein [Aurantiacibacter sp. D1-12]MDE1467686.1 hypothetical protein [Aurantiacibacter sp. D1-12]